MAIIRSPQFTQYHTLSGLSQSEKDGLRRFVQHSLDFRRAQIFFRRAKSIQDAKENNQQPAIKIFGDYNPDTRDHSVLTPLHNELEAKKDLPRPGESSETGLIPKSTRGPRGTTLSNSVSIIDIDADGPNKGFNTIKLPFIPRELNYNSESSFAAIKPIGSNNPRYHYTGAEDKLEFEIDWHSFDNDRRDVISQCRKIEALSKADGYTGSPHRVILQWGSSGYLFDGMEFIVLAAPYRMTQFSNGHINSDGSLQLTHAMPVQAYQKVTLARITSHNLNKVEIEYVAEY